MNAYQKRTRTTERRAGGQAKKAEKANKPKEAKKAGGGKKSPPIPIPYPLPKIPPPSPPIGGSETGAYNDTARQENPRNLHHNSVEEEKLKETPFDVFWTAYPKKVGKEAARKAWKRIKPDVALFRKIISAIRRAKQSDQWQREYGQFIPHPATWLNQGRWDDELTPMTGGGHYDDNHDSDYNMAGFHNALDRFDDDGNEITPRTTDE